jgi:glycosyltransferase involved in cell wall biosynthesis
MSGPTLLPRVSILIPTRNRAHYLPQTIESALRQDYANLEVVLLDNASTDDTAAVAARYGTDPRFRYTRNQTDIGMVRNWRRGLHECARGDWFLLLSDDDYLVDDGYIAKAMRLAGRDPDIVMVYAGGSILEEDTQRAIPLTPPFGGIVDGKRVFLSRDRVLPQDFTLCNVLFRRDAAIGQDAFHNPDNLSCDSELFLRMCLVGKVGVCPETVSVYRRHPGNLIGAFHLNFDQLVHNTELFILPYQAALQSGRLDSDELEFWRAKKVARNLRWTLAMIRKHHRRRVLEAVDYFSARYGALFWGCLRFKDRVRVEYLRLRGAMATRAGART